MLFRFVLCFMASLLVAGHASADPLIRTITAGPTRAYGLNFLLGKQDVSVVAPDAPHLAERLRTRFAEEGYAVVEPTWRSGRMANYVIIPDYAGPAADYMPQTADTRVSGGPAEGLIGLGIGLLLGQRAGLINMADLGKSNLHYLVDQAGKTVRDVQQHPVPDDRVGAVEKTKVPATPVNLVAYRLCMNGECSHAIAVSYSEEVSFTQLEEAAFNEGILKLAGLR